MQSCEFPAEWTLAAFPHPNPCFPPPKRPPALFGYLGALALASAAVATGWLGFSLLPADAGGARLGVLAGVSALAVACIVLANDRAKAAAWRTGPIVPARVLEGPKGPPLSAMWVVMMFLPVVGHIIHLFLGLVGENRQQAKIVYINQGEVFTATVNTGGAWKYYKTNLDVWVQLPKPKVATPLGSGVPRRWRTREVPAVVRLQMDELLPDRFREQAEARRAELLAPALHKAAKASTRAFKRATQYDRRPG